MMRTLLLLILLLSANGGAAETPGHPVTLWKVNGKSNTVYLLGSIHLLRKNDHPLPQVIESAYDDAEVLIMEIDMDDLDPFGAQAAFIEYGVLQDDTTLRDLMGHDLYQRANAAAEAIDIPLDMLAKTEPWYAAVTVEMMALNRIGFDPSLGVEMYMSSKAAADGKTIHGLETIEEQLQFLDGLSMPAQREMLISTLEESAALGEIMDELIAAWRHGDTELLESELLDSFADFEELNKVLITDRNARWVDKIGPLLNENDDFLVIVGALHLIGENGVPARLARKGLAIEQLSEAPILRQDAPSQEGMR